MQNKTMMTVALEMINDASTDFKSFNFDYGKMSGNYQDETLFIYTVRVNKYMREKGILRNFCQSLWKLNIKRVAFLAVESFILDSYLQRFVCQNTGKRFKCFGSDYLIEF